MSSSPKSAEDKSAKDRARSARLRQAFIAMGALVVVLLGQPSGARALEPGDPAADFERPSLDGGSISLAEHRGKIVYLDFWASWCKPCKTALPLIEELRREFPAEDFQVLAVNLDKSEKKAKKFLAKNPVGYPSVHDARGELPKLFGLETMPTSYLIDREGVVRYVHRGFRKSDVRKIRDEISGLLAADSVPAGRAR